MNSNQCKALHFYNGFFRDRVNEKAARHQGDCNFLDYIKKQLKITKVEDWGFICSSMDIIDDSLLGIEHFLRFGLDGPTKYNDVGEKYIRLYGVLNATYIQQQALENLYRIVNVPDISVVRERIQSLQIRDARNKLGAHCTDFSMDGSVESFVPVRVNLGGTVCEYLNNSTMDFHTINLAAALNEHLGLMNEMYLAVCKKFIATVYKHSSGEVRAELLDDLDEGRILLSGGFVHQRGDGVKVILDLSATEETA